MNKKKIFLQALPSMLFSICILLVLWLFNPPFWIVMTLILTFGICRYCYGSLWKKEMQFSWYDLLKSLVQTTIFLLVIYFFLRITKGWGIFSLILFVLIMAAYLLWKNKNIFLDGMRDIEMQLFGKPLDKSNWKPGEFKNRQKKKFVWRKNEKK